MFGSTFGQDGKEKEIEARRRSAIDKNFMRFGRTFPNPHMLYHMATEGTSDERMTKRNTNKETRSPVQNTNFLRFGRAGNSFMRLGRSNGWQGTSNNDDDQELSASMLMERPQIRANSNGFMRFGRTYKPQPMKFVPAGAIWPLQQLGQEEYLEEEEEPVLDQ